MTAGPLYPRRNNDETASRTLFGVPRGRARMTALETVGDKGALKIAIELKLYK